MAGNMMAAVPEDHPLMVAWNEYKKTADFANTMKWAKTNPEYVDGSLWGAFMAGFNLATERAASLHESVRTHCDHEPDAGAGAMGAVINYRDLIRAKA
jgi:hypothetical protein